MKNTYIKHEITIEELCNHIVAKASEQLQEHGAIPATFICLGSRRTVQWTAQSLSNALAVAEFANDCRLLCVSEEASAAIFVARVELGCGRPFAIKTPDSSANGGPEYLLIQIELDGGQNQTHMVPILPGTGGRPKLGNCRVLLNGLLARITNALLPKAKPTEAEQTIAKLAIQQNPWLASYNPFQSN